MSYVSNKLSLIAAAGAAVGAASVANAESIYLLEDVGISQQLSVIDSATPGTVTGRVSITGLGSGEELLGIDIRPATGELYGLSSGDALYTIDASTGAATKVGAGFTDQPGGTFFGFDFNPVIDKVRIVSSTDANFVADPDSGDANVASTSPLFFVSGDANEGANPNIVGSAYTNSFDGATSTQLYGIGSGLDILVTQNNNTGELTTVGSLGIDIVDIAELDISGTTGIAYLAAIENGTTGSTLYAVDLATGELTTLGQIDAAGNGLTIAGIAVGSLGGPAAVPTPAALPAGLALLGFIANRRSRRAQA